MAHLLDRTGSGPRLAFVFGPPHVAELVDPAEADQQAVPIGLVLDEADGGVGGPIVAADVRRIEPRHKAVAVERIDVGWREASRPVGAGTLEGPPAVGAVVREAEVRASHADVLGPPPARSAQAGDAAAPDLEDD